MVITGTHKLTHRERERKRPTAKNVIVEFRGPQNVLVHQKLYFENLTQINTFTIIHADKKEKIPQYIYRKEEIAILKEFSHAIFI